MSTLEIEIIEKFQQLDSPAKQRVLAALTTEWLENFDYAAWWAAVEELQASISTRIGKQTQLGTLNLLRELREESA